MTNLIDILISKNYICTTKKSIGYKENEEADPRDMLVYYSQESIEKFDVLGIEIKLLKINIQ